MTANHPLTTIVTNRDHDVFTLPDRIAREQGLFEKHGIAVKVALELEQHGLDSTGREYKRGFYPTPDNPLTNPADAAFETGASDTHQLCEWGAIDRIERGSRSGRIAYLRPAVVTQAIVSWQPDVQEPHDLADRPVDVTASYYGAHYNTLQILEGVLTRDQIKLSAHGLSRRERFEKAKSGELAAITIMEPWLSLALKQGAHIVALASYRGAAIIADHIPDEARAGYVAAINEAVDIINADPARYAKYLTDLTDGELEPHELSSLFYRYSHALPFSEKRFQETYSWMRSWNLTKGERQFEDVVRNAVLGHGSDRVAAA